MSYGGVTIATHLLLLLLLLLLLPRLVVVLQLTVNATHYAPVSSEGAPAAESYRDCYCDTSQTNSVPSAIFRDSGTLMRAGWRPRPTATATRSTVCFHIIRNLETMHD